MGSIADRVKIAQDKDGMLRRALERIIQLYTDRSHFVYELLQNAEDAGATSIRFIQYPDRLEVLHDGKPFTALNLQGLCDIGKSDKIDDLNQIGEFGVGFKSVFGICDTVKLYSDPSHYRKKDVEDCIPFAVEIIDFTSPEEIKQEPIPGTFTTRFIFPYTVGRTFSGFKTTEDLNRTLAQKLQNLGITTLLFMKNLELIEYEICVGNDKKTGQYLLEKKPVNDHFSIVSALGMSDTNEKDQEKSEEISYLKFSRSVDTQSNRTVDVAFPVVIKNSEYICQKPENPFISVYFPTETESKLGFIVQGPYRTTPNRSSIPADDEDNLYLAKQTAILVRDSILELRDSSKLNMSFIKVLPLSEANFTSYNLFYPVFEMVKRLFNHEHIIPCKNGGYTIARSAKIARQEKLAALFSDKELTDLIHDGEEYRWLPTNLTETSRDYDGVYRYFTSELKIGLIRPEELRTYFTNNPEFLPKQNNDWIVELYSILENIGAAFSKSRNEANMLTADIIKTSSGHFAAAYRKTDDKQYIPNVFLPSSKVTSSDINYVDKSIYERCRHFFDDILQLQKPNEYEFFIKDVRKRYAVDGKFDEEKHIEDLKKLHKYLHYEEYCNEIREIISSLMVLKCTDGQLRSPFAVSIFLPVTTSGIRIQDYLKNIAKNVFFLDADFYESNGVSFEVLSEMGVNSSLLRNETVTGGQYYTGMGGRRPDWWTIGDFRWKLSLAYLKDAVQYIENNPGSPNSIIKSKTIFALLQENESKLCGTVLIGGSTPNLQNEPCEMVHFLKNGRNRTWSGKWLYTESLELVAPHNISKHDLSSTIYGKIKPNSIIYELLEFRKTDIDEVNDLKKTVPKEKLDAYFENELKSRFGISSIDLTEHFGKITSGTFNFNEDEDDESEYPFPTAKIKNWETLKKHAAEMLCYANPVKYDYVVRRVRTSNHPKEARAYLLNMYRYDGTYKYACQMCHDSCSNIEAVQLFNSPETELDPMNLCLCPTCAAIYRQSRGKDGIMSYLKQKLLALQESDMKAEEYVSVEVDSQDLWFTQVHIAEIQALLQLENDANESSHKNYVTKPNILEDRAETPEKNNGLSVYNAYKGKWLSRKDGFRGQVVKVVDGYLIVDVKEGKTAGTETKIQIEFLIKNPKIYSIEEK